MNSKQWKETANGHTKPLQVKIRGILKIKDATDA